MDNPMLHPWLEFSPEEMRSFGYRVIDMLVEHFDQVRDKPVTRRASRISLERSLREPIPEQGTEVNEVLEQLQQDVFCHIMHLDSPRFFAFVPSPSNFASVMAETLATGFNIFAGTWLEASGPAQVEIVTLDWLRQLCGMPDTTGGLFVSGGSVANLTALATARHMRLRDTVQNATVYFSDQTHSSIERALHILGFDSTQMRNIPCDDQFRIPLDILQHMVNADRASGLQPFCVVANAGTVNTGAIDPLPELARFCREEGMWLHIDGAYGAAAALSNQGKAWLQGLEHADSLTLDPHKWLFQPYEIGCVLVRDGQWLRETFHILPAYLQDIASAEHEVNFCDYGIQLTRKFNALKLWMSLKIFGLAAFRHAIERGIALAEAAEAMLRLSPRWEVVTPAQIGIVTFRYVVPGYNDAALDSLNHLLLERMMVDGFAMLSSTVLRGKTVLRLCTINPRAREADIQETLARLERFAEGIHL
ncbi:MAG TPA: aminotransferase class V-fold PLP-dependent enzyme [Ktedonobacteraceae bacterium]|jgi:glutamate/tyrosine decarboxylase-like PLP-dependent enzyme|nr:aminotransferase class V-fold PLP-dependent enzyme [Ktedonobacteraceae bacterium]